MTRILVIEDDASFREILKEMLERKHYEVVTANDGVDGLKAFRAAPADIVITDLIMPSLGGLRAIKMLKEEFPDVKIIAMSGGGFGPPEKFFEAVRSLGVHHTLEKPFSHERLFEMLKELIG